MKHSAIGRRAFVLLALLTIGCGAKFQPETVVDSLRVLAVTAEPPEVAPGEPATMNVLFASPTGGTRSVLWVGCEPDPQDLGRSACNDATFLLKPTSITEYPPGLRVLGFGTDATYSAARTTFDVLASDSPLRQSGSVGQVISLVIGEDVDPLATDEKLRGYFERIEKKETEAVVALTRVLVSEKPLAERNHNPSVGALQVDGAPHPLGARLLFKPGQELRLRAVSPASSREAYVEHPASGPVEKVESVVGAWYSTQGRFSRERFDATADDETTFIAPGSSKFPEDVVSERRTGVVWLVVRDNRGGQAFSTFPFVVCDEATPAPVVAGVTFEGADGKTVVITGQNGSAIVDAVVGGVALRDASFNAARQAFIGQAPPLASGQYEVSLRTKRCETVSTGVSFVQP